MKKTDRGQYIGLRPDIEIEFLQFQEAKVFLERKEIADIELDSESNPVFQAVVPLLDGSRTVESVIAHLQQANIAEDTILACLDFLMQSGFIFQFDRPHDLHQAASFSWRTNDSQEILDRIAKSTVCLQGKDPFIHLISEGLTGAGVQNIKRLPATINSTEIASEWESGAADADLIILFGEPWEWVVTVNAWCIKNSKPLIVGWWQRNLISFGPIFIPGVTACPLCINERQGQSHYPDLRQAIPQAGSFPMVSCAANLLAGICVEFLGLGTLTRPLTSIHEIDLRQVKFIAYPALKNPRCRACSRLKTWPEGAVIDA